MGLDSTLLRHVKSIYSLCNTQNFRTDKNAFITVAFILIKSHFIDRNRQHWTQFLAREYVKKNIKHNTAAPSLAQASSSWTSDYVPWVTFLAGTKMCKATFNYLLLIVWVPLPLSRGSNERLTDPLSHSLLLDKHFYAEISLFKSRIWFLDVLNNFVQQYVFYPVQTITWLLILKLPWSQNAHIITEISCKTRIQRTIMLLQKHQQLGSRPRHGNNLPSFR